jgi:PAS domain S-box-containing protein
MPNQRHGPEVSLDDLESQTRLLDLMSALSRTLKTDEVAGAVVRHARTALNANPAALWMLSESTGLELLGIEAGPDAQHATEWRTGFYADTLIPHVIRTGSPLFLHSREELSALFPDSAARAHTADAPPPAALACLPLRLESPVAGALLLGFEAPRAFDERERAYLLILAFHTGQALDRARLFHDLHESATRLAETNRTLETIFSASPAAIMLLETDGTVRLWNEAAEHILGWTAEDAIGRFLPAIPEEKRLEFQANLARVARGERILGQEARRLSKHRGMIDVVIWAAPVAHTDGRVQCMSIVMDITDRKQVELERELAMQRVREADQRKDEFLAMLGHELRNPLAPILTALQIMGLKPDAGFERERVILERQVRYLERLVDDLLDVSRITRGKIELRKSRLELSDVVEKAIELASPMMEQKRQRLSVDVPESGLAVIGDHVRLTQVVANLLTNAAKYTHTGGDIAVSAGLEDGAAVIRVRDNGAGIPLELLPLLFEMFTQAPLTLARSRGGLGLGLTIVRSLVEMHGGTVSASSDGPDRGSEFVIRLPSAPAARDEARSGPAGEDHGGLEPAPSGRRVLVIDDNRDVAELTAEVLMAVGHEVRVAFDGPSGLEQASTFQPQVIFLDVGLPVMDGYEVARRIRQQPGGDRVRLVAVTGYGQQNDRARALDAGFDLHLVKPVDVDRLIAAASPPESDP